MTSNKVRLQKRELSAMDKMDVFLMRHAPLILTILFILLFIMIATLIVVVVIEYGNAPSMTDSGTVYNQFKNII